MSVLIVKPAVLHRNSEINAMTVSWKGRRMLYTSRPNFLWRHCAMLSSALLHIYKQ